MNDWNSNQYTKFEKERTLPSIDLINRINITPESILDIGCGPGNSTNQLYEHFSDADILGIDNSDNMLSKAKKTYPHLKFNKCFVPDELDNMGSYDLIFSNACLHWIPDHKNLFPRIMNKLNHGGIFAVQMPLVQDAMFYKVLNTLISQNKWKKLNAIQNFHNLTPNETYDVLSEISKEISMWETTYYHIVPSYISVIDWYKGSGLRPYLEMLDSTEQTEFLNELLEMIKNNYPVQADGCVILKMPRLFFTAIR